MDGRLRVDILEGQNRVVLVLDLGGSLAGHDAAEHAVLQRDPPGVPAIIRRRNAELAADVRAASRRGAGAPPPGARLWIRSRNGNVSEVQAEDSQERQPRQARLDLVPQGLPAPSARVGLSPVPPALPDPRATRRLARLRRVAQPDA